MSTDKELAKRMTDAAQAIDEAVSIMGCDWSTYLHPTSSALGHAIADLLEVCADHVSSYDCERWCEPDGCDTTNHALAVADLILGGES